MKISIVYYSKTGNTENLSKIIKEGAEAVENIEVKTMNIYEIDEKFLNESKAVIFGTPTYYSNTTWELKKWIDESRNFNLEGKLGAVFSTADYIGGGADTAILTVISQLMVKGMMVYSGGSALGQPYIHLGYVSVNGVNDKENENAKIFGYRIAKKVKELYLK